MKLLIMILVLVALAVFLAAYSFESYFSEEVRLPLPSEPTPEVVADPAGGGSPRDPAYRPGGTAPVPSSSGTFQGPSGPPRIIGPSEPPPGSP